jgi:hypothetical protein
LPGLYAANFHKFTSLILPRQFSVGDLGVDLIDGAVIGGSDQYDISVRNEVVISDAFRLAFNAIIDV